MSAKIDTKNSIVEYFENHPDGMSIYDPDMRLVVLNRSCLSFFAKGTTMASLAGKTLLEIAPYLKGSFRYRQYLNVLKTGKTLTFETSLSHPLFGSKRIMIKAFRFNKRIGAIMTDLTGVSGKRISASGKISPQMILSDREYAVFCRLAAGQSQKEIAGALRLNLKTIHTYRRRIMHKMRFTSNADLVRYAMVCRLI